MNNYYDNIIDDMLSRTFMIPAVVPNSYNDINNMIINSGTFINEKEGFLRGNMEINSYIPYKNMTYKKPTILNEKSAMLYNILELSFAAHDINLYLDTHPNDKNAINLYIKYNNEARNKTIEYEKKYGPIDLSFIDGQNQTSWSWINEWPWNE